MQQHPPSSLVPPAAVAGEEEEEGLEGGVCKLRTPVVLEDVRECAQQQSPAILPIYTRGGSRPDSQNTKMTLSIMSARPACFQCLL